MSSLGIRRWGIVCVFVLAWTCCQLGNNRPTRAQEARQDATDAETARQQQIVERFLTVLERSPRRGTALDRVYGFHIENGTIDVLVKQFEDRTTKNPKDGTAWMILGLVESQRGRDAQAVRAFEHARGVQTDNPLASYYLGQSLILIGQPDKAVEAFEDAIAKKPAQTDLLAVFQALGRVHQQAQHVEQALAVWNRLEQLFPGDLRVQEDIASTLVEEGQFAEALPRYEVLARQSKDEYRKTVFRMQVADLKTKLNRGSEGVKDLEELLSTLNPQNWLYRDVRRHIEEVFLRSNDDDGLANYYKAWLEKNPEDVDAMARVARVLARQARVPEAQTWLDKALKLAPSRKELRLAFIDQLVDEQRYAEAAAQYAELDKSDPNNTDYLRNWGKLVLRDATRAQNDRQAEAEKIWRRMAAARANDPLVAAQVADLFRYAQMNDPALEFYQRAVELAPTAAQYREYLGEFYHILKRPDEALATWRKLSEGKQRTATNVARLAEVLAQFGYLEQALPEIAAACELDPKDFSLQLKAGELQIRGTKFDDALASLARGEKLAQNDEEREVVLAQRLKVYVQDGRLTEMAKSLREEIKAAKPSAEQWFLLARYEEELRNFPESAKAIGAAVELESANIRILTSAARIVEQSGELGEAAGLHRKLAVVDRRARSEHLQHVAQLESQLGRIDEALVAGRELLAAAPGNVDTHQFFADLCFRLGKPEEGLTALRRAVRANPSDQNIVLALASALAGQFRSDEAIELYWQAFDKATSLDDRLHVVGKLTELYLQINHFDRLLERLERNRQEADARREMTICLAQAHQSAGDYGMARQELERLLSENSRDTQLLQQLSKLAESEADLSSAAAFQEQVAKVAPGPEAEYRLATLLSRSGRSQEASEILVRLIAKEEDKEKMFRSIDSLLAAGEQETALHVIEPKLRENPSDWELLYREGVALAERSTTEAAARFEAILKLENLDDELGTVAKAREKAKNKQAGAQAQPTTRGANYTLPAFMRVDNAYEIQRATGLQPDRVIRSGNQMTVWTPQRFNQARMAALGWLMRFAQEAGKTEEFVEPRKSAIKSPDAKDRALWDWIYLQSVRADTDELMSAAQKVAARGSLAGQYVYLSQLNTRNAQSLRGAVEAKDSTPPLSAEELDLAVRAFEAVQRGIAGSEYPNISFVLMQQTQNIIAELKRAGRADEEQKLYERSLTEAKSSAELAGVLQLAAVRRDIESTLAVFDRFARRDLQELDSKSLAQYSRSNVPRTLCLAMGRKESAGKDVLAIVDRYLVYQAAKANAARKGTRSKTSATRSAQQNYIYIQLGGMGRNVSLPYPTANTYFDNSDLTVLRNAFEWFKQADLVSDFIKHLSDRQGAYASGEKVYGVLALAYTSAWNDDPDTATKALIAATGLEPQELELRLDLAQFCIQSNQLEEALAQLDAVAPSNQNALKERELLALDVAVRLGEMERARQAAQRLFGVRLDADTQIQLVGKMRRLGMNAEAEAIMARAQRQAGSQLSSLVALLTQYLSDGHMDLAAEVAHQVLRRSRTLPAGQQAMGYSTADGNARATALQCLAQTGKLKEIIARVEAQLERSPRSVQLVETLAEYYQAAGNMDKALELQKLLVEQRPNDGELRYRYAQSLARQNKHDEACEQYKLAIKRQPRLLENRSYEVVNTFQRAKKEAELGKFLGELEIKAIGSPNAVVNMISTLVRDKNQRDVGLVLLKKSWKAFPSQRQYLIQGLYDDELWKIPEVFEFGRESLLPVADAIRQSPWAGLQSVMSFSQNGHVNSVVEKILKAAAGGNQLPEFRDAVAKHLEEHPDWLGGKALLAVIDLGLKREVDVRAALAPLLEGGNDYRLQYARWVIGQEMEAYPEQRELTMQLYRAALQDRENVSNQFQYSPGPRLVQMYLAADRREEARKLLVDASREKLDQYQYDPAYQAYQRVENLTTLGKQFAGNDFPIDALRIYRELLTDSSLNDSSLQRYGRSIEQTRKEAEKQIELILRDLSGSALEGRILEMLTVQEDAPSDESSIDLLLSAKPAGNMALPKLDSLLATFISSATLDAPALGALTKHLTGAAQKRPRDLSIAIMQALIADKAGAPEDTQRTRERLASLMTSTPLEELPPNGRANARQRAAALRQVPLWLVAKQCLKHPESSKLGEQLAERAQAAAARQLDVNMAVAILNEQALESLEAGRAADAQRAWNEIVEVAIVRPRTKNTRRDAKGHEPPAPDRIAAKPLESVPLTLSQFRVGAALAQIAADKKQQALSLRAMREVVVGGLPVADLTTSKTSRPRQVIVQQRNSTSSMRNSADQAIIDELATSVWQISENWEAKKFPPEEVSTVLEQLVFPVGRPNEILLYEQPLEEDWLEARSVGGALAKWAVRAKRQEQIKEQVARRKGGPSDVMSGHVLLAELYVAAGEHELVRSHLAEIEKLIETTKLATLSDSAAHVVGIAFNEPTLRAQAAPLFEKVLTTWKPRNSRYAAPGANSAVTRLVRYYVRQGNLEAAKAQVDAYLKRRQVEYSQFGGDSPASMQRLDLAWATNELANLNHLVTTLDTLGRYADTSAASRQSTPLAGAMWRLSRHVAGLAATERYSVLQQWTLPTENRRAVRVVAAFLGPQQVPALFLPPDQREASERAKYELVSNLSLLIDAAKESGNLDELDDRVQPLAKENVPGAETLSVLVAIARRDFQPVSAKLEAMIAADRKEQEDARPLNFSAQPNEWSSVLIAYAAIVTPELRDSGETLLGLVSDRYTREYNPSMSAWLSYAAAQVATQALGTEEREAVDSLPLKLWHAASALQNTTGTLPPTTWVAQEGVLRRLYGSELDQVLFKYPLEGDFELTCEARFGSTPACNLAYGGIGFSPMGRDQSLVRTLLGDHLMRGSDSNRHNPRQPEQWHAVRLAVSPSRVKFSVNGWPAFEDQKPARTSPWLAFWASSYQNSVLRNLAIRGKVTIPREVPLVDGNRMDGWSPGLFGGKLQPSESLRGAGSVVRAGSDGDQGDAQGESAAKAAYDWAVADGVLHSAYRAGLKFSPKSWIYYQRPLAPGETLRYQFLYKPGEVQVHPTLGRMAYLLDASGLRLQWLHQSDDSQNIIALDPEEIADEPASRRAAVDTLLKADAWNDVELSIEGKLLTIRLNGEVVCERPLYSASETQFGLYHRPGQTAADVRGIVLTGNWPKELSSSDLANVLAPVTDDDPPVVLRARHSLLGEKILADNVELSASETAGLSQAERYEQLKQAVLPGRLHPTYRLQFGFTGGDGPARKVESPAEPFAAASRAIHAPAIELVRLAGELGKLDDLAGALSAATREFPQDRRDAKALEALIAIARGDDAAAAACLVELREGLKSYTEHDPLYRRQAELVAAHAALERTALVPQALAIGEALAALKVAGKDAGNEWERRTSGLLAHARWHNDPATAKLPFDLPWSPTLWSPVDRDTAQARSSGYPRAHWWPHGGQIDYYASRENDGLYFAVPLRGNFEVRYRQKSPARPGPSMVYAGVGFRLADDGKAMVRRPIGRDAVSSALQTPPTMKGDWADCRLVVRDSVLTLTVNDQQVASERLPAEPDPWLALQTSERDFQGTIDSLQVHGEPTAPKEINLSGDGTLVGWHCDYLEESLKDLSATDDGDTRGTPAWTKKVDEIVGAALPNAGGSYMESLLQYHRPLLEDGSLEYEFFYEAGKSEVHPALGRVVFLLREDGLHTHELTNGCWQSSVASPGDSKPIAGAKACPLKPRAWNRLRLSVAKDRVTISVNGEEVAEAACRPKSERMFGLFHYRDLTTARVRNVVYRGAWPQTVPPDARSGIADTGRSER